MTIAYLLTVLESLKQEYYWLFLLLEIFLKSSLILLVALPLGYLLRRQPAADKSAFWMVIIAALLLLPLFNYCLPGLPVPFTIEESAITNRVLLSLHELAIDIRDPFSPIASTFDWIVYGYAAISVLLALYLMMGILRVVIQSHNSRRWTDLRALEALDRLKADNGIASQIVLLASTQCASPLTWGIRRHIILLPASARNWDQLLLEQTLSHELAHIQRKDWLCYICSRMAICIYWINPLVWIAHKNLVMESEKSCDNAAIEDTGCAFSYAENLLRLANLLNANCTAVAPALFGRKSSLMPRIKSILDDEESRHHGERSCLVSALIVTAVLVAPFSAMNFNFRVIEDAEAESFVIPVNFIPRNSIEYTRFMLELGKL